MKPNNRPNQPEGTPAKAVATDKLNRLPLLAGLTFAAIVWILFNLFEREYLFRVQELSLWLPTKVYFDERMMVLLLSPLGLAPLCWLAATRAATHPQGVPHTGTPCPCKPTTRCAHPLLLHGGRLLDLPN